MLKKEITFLIVTFIIISAFGMNAGMINHSQRISEKAVTPIELEIPKGWPSPPTNIFAANPLTEEGFQLGRKLFYDGRLSKDGNFACASCHQQFAAFATYDHDLSHGFHDQFTLRNAPPLFNLAWKKLYHWDGGVNHIEVQALSPLTASNEMAENLDSVLDKLRADPVYEKMFKAAFGASRINSQRMLKALAQFVGTMVSANSRYDKVMRGEDEFNSAEKHGYELYKANCAVCHTEPLFTNLEFKNNGLAVNEYLRDYGRMRITGEAGDSLKFMVPSLRNLSVTFPYMHDGRLYSLYNVVDHYRKNIVVSSTLDSVLIKKVELSEEDKNDLVYFLHSLTDTTFLKDKRFSQPSF